MEDQGKSVEAFTTIVWWHRGYSAGAPNWGQARTLMVIPRHLQPLSSIKGYWPPGVRGEVKG